MSKDQPSLPSFDFPVSASKGKDNINEDKIIQNSSFQTNSQKDGQNFQMLNFEQKSGPHTNSYHVSNLLDNTFRKYSPLSLPQSNQGGFGLSNQWKNEDLDEPMRKKHKTNFPIQIGSFFFLFQQLI